MQTDTQSKVVGEKVIGFWVLVVFALVILTVVFMLLMCIYFFSEITYQCPKCNVSVMEVNCSKMERLEVCESIRKTCGNTFDKCKKGWFNNGFVNFSVDDCESARLLCMLSFSDCIQIIVNDEEGYVWGE